MQEKATTSSPSEKPVSSAIPVIKRSRPSSTIKIPGAGDFKNPEPEIKEEVKEESFGQSSFSEEELLKAWEAFAAKKKAEGKDSEYHVLQQKIALIDENTIQINLINKLQEDFIDKMRTDLMHHIRKTLNNDSVKLKIVIDEKQEKRMLYTNREKLEFLQEQKPIIRLLRDKLGLDPEF